MKKFQILKYYSRSDVQQRILTAAKDREVAGSLDNGAFLKRPDILSYPNDILEKVRGGAVAFHCSVERWAQPMQLSTNLKPDELDNLRKGFDFIIDIDAKVKIEHAAVSAKVVCDFLKDFRITPNVKFSGSRGFHICIASEAFPEKIDFKETKIRYPEIPQAITGFIIERTREKILEELMAIEGGIAALVSTVPSVSDITPTPFVDIDDGTYLSKKAPEFVDSFAGLEKGWGSRHLFRMPYSLHPKYWLVSLPMRAEDLAKFTKDMAKPENVKADIDFISGKEGEAADLLIKALEWKAKQPKEDVTKGARMTRKKSDIVVPEENFPPCIKLILNGLSDGKKRSLFTLLSFMRNMNWKPDDVEKRIRDWNLKNATPLSERFISTQLKWHFRQERELMPANCSSDMFYRSMGVCKPDENCSKNPVNYPFRKMRISRKPEAAPKQDKQN
jgi:hypothetical protein